MLSLALSSINPYVALGVAVVALTPIWGRMVLAFLRDLDDYRAAVQCIEVDRASFRQQPGKVAPPCPLIKENKVVALHQQLAEAGTWASEHDYLLNRCFERFQDTGEWPKLEQLQHDFAVGSRDEDVSSLAYAMPNALGFVEQQRFILRIRGLSYVPAASYLLEDWYASLRKACDRWLQDGEGASLTYEDVLTTTHGDVSRANLVSTILLREGWAFGGGTGIAGEEWSREVVGQVLAVRNAHNFSELLEIRDEKEFPPPSESPSETHMSPPPARDSRWRRLVDWAKEHYLGAVAAGLTVLLIGTVVGLTVSKPSGGGDGGPTGTGEVSGESTEFSRSTEDKAPVGPGTVEESGGGGASTYRDPFSLSQTGPDVPPYEQVRVGCRIHAHTLPSVKPDGNWYRLLSAPWNGNYYAPANSFMNGDVVGQTENIHNTDSSVPKC